MKSATAMDGAEITRGYVRDKKRPPPARPGAGDSSVSVRTERGSGPARAGKQMREKIVQWVFFIAIAVFFLWSWTANADADRWRPSCRHDWIHKDFEDQDWTDEDPPVWGLKLNDSTSTSFRIRLDEVRKLAKDLKWMAKYLAACEAYRKCLNDQGAGKVKHCYENDRRWRGFYNGGW
jgi:hypothetical protein